MEKVLLFLAFLPSLLCAVAQNGYLVKTSDVSATQPAFLSSEDEFIAANFVHYSLCDWYPGMKFMVMPERVDLIVSTFKSASSGKSVGNGELKNRIMEYQGVETTGEGSLHFNFLCDSVAYYCEVKNTTLADYCVNPKSGIKTLAYLGDVDVAQTLLVGKTLYTRGERYFQDDANAVKGFREVSIPKNTEVKVVAVGVGQSRAWPVKIIFEDAQGVAYYKEVAFSKTNSGMSDRDYVMSKADCLFGRAFGFANPNQSREEQLNLQYVGMPVYLKHDIDFSLNGTEQPAKRYTQYTIRKVEVENGSNYVSMTLTDRQGRLYVKRITFLRERVTGDVHRSENYFGEVFGVGDLRKLYPAVSEAAWAKIERGEVAIGMTMEECRLALGEPMRFYKDAVTGIQDWIYENHVILSFKAGRVVVIK